LITTLEFVYDGGFINVCYVTLIGSGGDCGGYVFALLVACFIGYDYSSPSVYCLVVLLVISFMLIGVMYMYC